MTQLIRFYALWGPKAEHDKAMAGALGISWVPPILTSRERPPILPSGYDSFVHLFTWIIDDEYPQSRPSPAATPPPSPSPTQG